MRQIQETHLENPNYRPTKAPNAEPIDNTSIKIDIEKIYQELSKGNLSVLKELERKDISYHAVYTVTGYSISFEYEGNKYSVYYSGSYTPPNNGRVVSSSNPKTEKPSPASYTKEELKNKYNLSERDINAFFKLVNGKYVINEDAVKSNFDYFKDDLTPENLLSKMSKYNQCCYSRTVLEETYGFTQEEMVKYFREVHNNYFVMLKTVLPDAGIKTPGQLKDVLDNFKSTGKKAEQTSDNDNVNGTPPQNTQTAVELPYEIDDFINRELVEGYSSNDIRFEEEKEIRDMLEYNFVKELYSYVKSKYGEKIPYEVIESCINNAISFSIQKACEKYQNYLKYQSKDLIDTFISFFESELNSVAVGIQPNMKTVQSPNSDDNSGAPEISAPSNVSPDANRTTKRPEDYKLEDFIEKENIIGYKDNDTQAEKREELIDMLQLEYRQQLWSYTRHRYINVLYDKFSEAIAAAATLAVDMCTVVVSGKCEYKVKSLVDAFLNNFENSMKYLDNLQNN